MATITTTGHGTHQSMSGTFHSTESSYNQPTDAAYTPAQYTNLAATDSNYEAPLPNPPFVFPARPAVSGPAVSRNRRQQSQSNNAAREGLDMEFKLGGGAAAHRAPPPLPSFSFNQTPRSEEEPGTGGAPLSPGLSARLSMPIPSRPAQHSRGASEFVFGAPKSGPGSLLSVSSQERGALPPPGRSGPPGGRRGHAHRRSAAISCGDLSFLVKPKEEIPPLPTNGSTPSTAADAKQENELAISSDNTGTEGEQKRNATPPRKAGRVGFSDTLEYIPRPLSLVSSDASSTMTIRQGHSLSNSLSSVVSVSSPSPPPTEHRKIPTSAPRSTNSKEDRPSTAGPVLGCAKSLKSLRGNDDEAAMRRNSDPPTLEEANNGRNMPREEKRYNFTDDFHGNNSASSSKSVQTNSVSKARPPLERINSASFGPGPTINYNAMDYSDMPRLARKTSSVRSSIKKKKKVKSWAGSILSGKSKPRIKKGKSSKRSATPPMVNYEYRPAMPPQPQLSQVIEKDDTPEIDLDEAYASTSSLPPLSNTQTSFYSWKPRHILTFDEDDSSSPIIDLDAALGPFNTPTHDSDWQAAQRTPTTTRRKMHSASKMNNFVGQGMHYHRRAESAPALVPFDNPRFRLGSSCTMEDVFEEDEEDEEWEEVKSVSRKSSTIKNDDEESVSLGIEIKVVDAENSSAKGMDWSNDDSSVRGIKRKTSALSELDINRAGIQNSARSSSPLREGFSMDDFAPPPPITDDACIIQRPHSSSRSSTSSATPPVREVYGKEFPLISNQSYTGQPPFLTPSTPSSTFNQSPIPSPRSRFSQDTQRQSSAPSSILEEPGFNPLWLGEPGPEIRMSVDDVPSLTSSNSTMTGGMANAMNPAFANPQFRNGQRSVSMSGPAATRKRGSIASLSRLLSSHGSEKSKLSIEHQAGGSDDGSTKKEANKGKRMSRIMQFWKKGRDATP